MSKEKIGFVPERLNLAVVNASLLGVEEHWDEIHEQLIAHGIGARDIPFDDRVRGNMMTGYEYLDELLREGIEPFSPTSIHHMLTLNNKVHYDSDTQLMAEYKKSIQATSKKLNSHIPPIIKWYKRHNKGGDKPQKLAAEVYVSILGEPQLFIEGNHRTGALIASWINMYHGEPPFVLSEDNAIPYFAPSAEIKQFANKSTWRGRAKLPKYRKSFYNFWQEHTDRRYIMK